ncbi:unnamed protein product [Notodromas monacha]|uniref:Methyltransferase FkbM domain-containing protein n=1 Tax=Notodromas monacha TaxID=399045 RepID=A0A7R9BUP0_9CRUS|nr:unnamed protein product [Notodromas monacha]CAG0921717.1 unnamed protein product [Notodromas monacha]
MKKAMELMRPGEGLKFENHPYPDQNVLCYPLLNMLAAANLLKVDVLFLDVDGAELDVLGTLRFQETDIKAIVLECVQFVSLVPGECTEELKGKFESLLKPWGYELKKVINHQDLLFIKRDAQ